VSETVERKRVPVSELRPGDVLVGPPDVPPVEVGWVERLGSLVVLDFKEGGSTAPVLGYLEVFRALRPGEAA